MVCTTKRSALGKVAVCMKKGLMEVYDVTRLVRDLTDEADRRNTFDDIWQERPFDMGRVK